jgi:endonuclease/exonuclease/phosphatase family metal-dependent hydrolase
MIRVFLLVAAAGLVLTLAILVRSLVAYRPPQALNIRMEGGESSAAAGESLRILSWNIGYAGLGRDSEFLADGGRRLRAPSRSAVERNIAAIAGRLRRERSDVVMIQELARPGWLTYGVDVKDVVQRALEGYRLAYAPAVRMTGLPVIGSVVVGSGTLTPFDSMSAVRHALPSMRRVPGVSLQHFNALLSRFPIQGRTDEWVIVNVHLSAFDDGSLRREQLEALLPILEREYAAGHYVIAGGDWNLRLASTEFPYTTDEKAKSWVRDFPAGLTPHGWHWAVDPSAPTCRTLEQPYRPGVNYRCVIDGFLVSPNVEVLTVETSDLEFENSDHNPVRLEVRAR